MIKLLQKKILSDTEIDQGYDLIRNKFLVDEIKLKKSIEHILK